MANEEKAGLRKQVNELIARLKAIEESNKENYDGLHDAVLRTDRGGGGVGVDLLRVLAAKELQTGSAEQDAGGKQTNMFHSNTSMSSEFAG